MTNPRVILNFGQRYKVIEAVKEFIEPDGEGFVKYKDNLMEHEVAAKLSEALGFKIERHVLKEMRQQALGQMRKGGNANAAAKRTAEIDGLRSEIAGLRAAHTALSSKLENLRKVIEHHDANAHNRRAACSAKLRELVGKGIADERIVRTGMRGAGYSDEEISLGLYLTGAIVRQNGAGSTLQINRG